MNPYRIALDRLLASKQKLVARYTPPPRPSRAWSVLEVLAITPDLTDAARRLLAFGIDQQAQREIDAHAEAFDGPDEVRYVKLVHWLAERARGFENEAVASVDPYARTAFRKPIE